MLGDDPPYLSVGTEVSAKYKGAFCEAKIRKVVRSVKCRVTYKQGLGTSTVTDDQIKGTLRVGAQVEARHNDRKEFVEATITKIQDCSQYTVVFDDGDITTLRRTALCLKSGRHFAESETLDQLPLTHPEHFGNPVIGGRRGRRSRQAQDDSSDDDDDGPRGSNDSGSISGGKEGPETEPEIGRVVCVELGDKKKKDNWFPGLVVAPTAQDTVRIRVRDDYLVRSFKDARYYTVPKKEATEFTKDLVNKVENSALKIAVEKAILYLEKNELPPHWDRDSLFGNSVSSGNSDSDADLDSDSSDDEPREEKDHFVAQLYKFMDDRGTPINNCPMIGNEDIDLYRLFRAVYKLGGYNRVTNQNQWKLITRKLSFSMQNNASTHNLVKQAYKKFLHSFEDFYRKLGCTMVNHPRGGMRKQRPGRSLIRDKDRNTPVPIPDKTIIKTEKEEEDKDKKINVPVEEEPKKEKREVKKEPVVVKEEEVKVQTKPARKEEPAEESVSGQESDINIEGGEESSCSERSQKSSSRLTPSSNVSSKSKTTAKTKEDTATTTKKKAVVEKKKPETVKKQEKKEEKPGTKEEDTTKTRSRSKEDTKGAIKPNSEVRETRTPSRETDKKGPTKQRRMTEEELKKRGRKKKETENEKGKGNTDDKSNIEYAPTYKGPVEVGDRLKVYYGPTHESKVTYEAKVIDMEKDGTEALYLVHYTGWNTRYDEWIKCSRIAHNFTQAQGRVKRTKATRPITPSTNTSQSMSKSSKTPTTAPNAGTGNAVPSSANRRRAQSVAPTSKDMQESGGPATRSTTPSPLTSSVLRTKSPATNSRPTRTTTRNADSSSSSTTNDLGRRTRRTSGHVAAEESESDESESMESDASAEQAPVQSRSRVKNTNVVQERSRREARRRAESRMKIEETSDGETEKDIEEPRRGRRIRKPVGKMEEVKSEPESDEEQPKGRDFDLNQIRSELKGFDKAVKMEIATVAPEKGEEDERSVPVIKQEKVEPDNQPEKKVIPEPEKKREPPPKADNIPPITTPIKRETIKIETNQSDSTEDIYEFKEPEPFEFEVRNKRDSGGSSSGSVEKEKEKEKDKESKVKKRVVEEDLKSPKKRQKTFNPTTTTPVKTESKPEVASTIVENTDNKKKARKIFKKGEEAEEAEDSEESGSRELSKYFPANYGNVFNVYKRKGATFGNPLRAIDDSFAEETTEDTNEDKSKKIVSDDENKSPKKRLPKTLASAKVESTPTTTSTTTVETKKQPRKVFSKKPEEADDEEGDDSTKELSKFFPNYSEDNKVKKDEPAKKKLDVKKRPGRRAANKKGAEDTDDSESDEGQDHQQPQQQQPPPPTKYFSHYSGPKTKAAAAAALINEPETPQTDIQTNETVEPVPSTSIEKKSKPLDFTPIIPHTLPVPAPISARLPATASIEEKLSAAAVFRSKMKEEVDVTPRAKIVKEPVKKEKPEVPTMTKKKEEVKKPESEKKRPEPKKDPLHEIEIRKDPLLEVMKKKDDDILSSSIPIVTKTYGGQKKNDQAAKIEETWKKTVEEPAPNNDYTIIRKETIVSKIKSSIERDSIDSTDSSDSERRLTIIDSEDFVDEKTNESSSEAKSSKTVSMTSIIKEPISQIELAQQIGSIIQARSAKMEEDGENLNSLLCEEEIPGSPTPGTDHVDQDHRATSSNLVRTELASKAAVAFVAAQLPLSTIAPPSQITNCAAISTISGGVPVPQSTNSLVTIAMAVHHSNAPAIRQAQLPPQLQIQPQAQPQPQQPQQPQQQQHQIHPLQQLPQLQPQQLQQPVVVVPAAQQQRRESNEAAPVMDNTPPTTPDSTISNISNSPRDEHTGGSTPSSSEDNNSKMNRDSSEAENDGKGSGEDDGSSHPNSELPSTASSDRLKPPAKRLGGENDSISPKKRKKRKDQENISSGKKSPRQSTRNTRHGGTTGSDSDDTSEGSNQFSNNSSAINNSNNPTNVGANPTNSHSNTGVNNVNSNIGNFTSSSSGRSTKYDFLCDIDSNLDGPQRIQVLTSRISELRKTYISIKAELAIVERRRKKIKRRKREAQKAAKAEMQQACS